MNFVTFAVFLIFCGHACSHTVRSANKPYMDLSGFVDKIKSMMKSGNDSLGIPVLDPLTVDELPIKLDEKGISLNATLRNAEVNGLSDFDLIKGDFNIKEFELGLNILLPLILANTKYDLKAKADIFQIYGNGSIEASVRDFAFELDIGFLLKNEYLEVKEIKTSLSLKELDFRATGLFDDEELSKLVSTIISDMAPEFVSDYQDVITEKLNSIITEKLNVFLAKHSLSEILSWVLG